MKRGTCALFAVLCLLAFSITGAHGQALSTIRGAATDSTGAVMADVAITVTAVKTNVIVRTVTTNGSGDYEVPDVIPGVYRITAEKAGFKSYLADNIVVEGVQIRRVDIRMELGQVAEKITVEAGASVITTDTAQISSSFKTQLSDDTPMVKSYYPHSLLVTLPGVQSEGSTYNLRINGQPSSQLALGQDGVTSDGAVNMVNKLDFSEISVTGVNNSAENARVVNYNMVSKRGDNEYHGDVYFTNYNSALNARRFFDPKKTAEKEFRGQLSFGGPIIKNRTFFYGSYFYQKVPARSYYIKSVPSLKMRQGDFSQYTQTVKDPTNGQPFPGKVIPNSRMSATSLKIQDGFYPQPNLGDGNTLVNNFGFTHPFPADLYEARYPQFRIDHNITTNNSIYARWIRRRTPYVLTRDLPGFTWTRSRSHTSTVVNDTHVFSPNMVNSFRFGLRTDFMEDGKDTGGVTPVKGDEVLAAMGIQGTNQAGYKGLQGSPYITVTGLSYLGMAGVGGGVVNDYKSWSWADFLTYSIGRHVVKFGGELKTFDYGAGNVVDPNYGTFNFNGSLSGVGYADFLLGLPYTSQRVNPLVGRTQQQKEFGIFVTDTFKVTSKLNLDLGIRWDYFGSPRYKDGLQYAWDPKTANVVVQESALKAISPLYPKNIGVVSGDAIPDPDMRNIRPRLGFAYRLKDKTVVRGGYGTYSEQIGYMTNLQGGGPFQISEVYTNTITGGVPLFSFPNPFPASLANAAIPSQSVGAFPMQTDNGTIHQFNLSVEQQIADLGLRLSYIGSRSRGLNYNMGINKPAPSLIPFTQSRRPYPQFVGVTMMQNDGANNFNSLQMSVQRKAGAIVTFNAHYTYQSSLSNNLNLENPYDHLFWNRDAWNVRHRALINTTIEIPVGKGKRFLSNMPTALNHAIGGWRLITITLFQSGGYFNAGYSGSDQSNTNTSGGLPDRICDGNIPVGQRTLSRWFDTSCFVAPPKGRFGNSGVNIMDMPGENLHHMSVAKDFKLSERFEMEFVTSISNVFNHPIFSGPLTNISAPGTGMINAIRMGADQAIDKTRAREMEMTLRLKW